MSNTLLYMVLVAAGGFGGAISRYWMSGRIAKRFPGPIPYGTLSVNVLGAFLLGWLWGHGADTRMMALLGSGFLGAFTTFSTFKLESWDLMAQGRKRSAWIYMGLTYTAGIAFVYLGYII
ncbi:MULTISPECIES: fluoride efflux transporter CrcB [Paenibacillus]|uniref:Fluoride-specific ion channel FluC n=1 Tax=Paenibacillus naphthalenovorans TaxID=162209 RepID=A0A0U2VD92_9BACL|nr:MULTISPECIES: fluoride efflux transporter CrcB [Paenibacillus]ALS21507.1 fluoride ion transporter CrcB [Paenibacillus naphthalenovorans]GCL71233.1 fluoride efflux transporter CrcB [Paenibacillus naphthalenovorans]SDI76386.1 CrcB protein [Paenibacillus naphthalenovorans]